MSLPKLIKPDADANAKFVIKTLNMADHRCMFQDYLEASSGLDMAIGMYREAGLQMPEYNGLAQ